MFLLRLPRFWPHLIVFAAAALSALPARAADGKPASPSVPVVASARALSAQDKAAIDGGLLAGCTTTVTHYYVWVPITGVVTYWVPVEYARVVRTVCTE